MGKAVRAGEARVITHPFFTAGRECHLWGAMEPMEGVIAWEVWGAASEPREAVSLCRVVPSLERHQILSLGTLFFQRPKCLWRGNMGSSIPDAQ